MQGETERQHAIPDCSVAVFIAYFPTWIKFYKLHRLGGHIYPFDLITALDKRNANANGDHKLDESPDKEKELMNGLKELRKPNRHPCFRRLLCSC